MKEVHATDRDIQRFKSKVSAPTATGCTTWTAGTGYDGRYGRFQLGGKVHYAHRVAYVIANGRQLEPGETVDHKCWNTLCVNPDHLQAVPAKANSENRAGAQRAAFSGVRGVNWSKSHGMWVVRAGHAGHRYFGGYFTDKAEAEAAAVALRNRLFTNNLADQA